MNERAGARPNRDLFAGAAMIAVGLVFAYFGYSYQLGTLRQMGPGFMPLALGLVLALVGLLILIGGITTGRVEDEAFEWPDLRGCVAIVASVVSFILLGERAGLAISAFAVVAIAALGDPANRLHHVVLLATGMAVLATVVFFYGLQVRLPLLPEFAS